MLISVLAVTLNIDPDVSWLTPSMKLVSLKLDGLWHLDVPFANCARTRTHLLPRQQLRETRQRSAAVLWGGWCHGYCLWTKAQVWQKVKWTEFGPIRMDGWQAIRGPPRPPQQHYVETQNFSCKCGGVAILKKGLFHFQAIPVWYSLHGLLSTYFQLSMGKRFTLCQFIVSDEILFQAGFDYAAQFGNSAVYIGMDASTDTLSSQALSQAHLSQRWYHVSCLFPQIQQVSPQSICFDTGTLEGRRIDHIFANSPAISCNFYHFFFSLGQWCSNTYTSSCGLSNFSWVFSIQVNRILYPETNKYLS